MLFLSTNDHAVWKANELRSTISRPTCSFIKSLRAQTSLDHTVGKMSGRHNDNPDRKTSLLFHDVGIQ